MRLIKGIIMGIGVIGILVIIAVTIGFYLYSLSPSILGRAIPVAVSPEAAQSFDDKIEAANTQLKSAIEDRQEQEINLVITESEANSKLVQLLAEGKLPLKRVLVNFDEGYFLIYGVVDAPVIDAKMAAIGRITVSNGKPNVVLDEYNLGKLPLPPSAKNRAQQVANILVSLQTADVPLNVTSVEFSGHQISVSGTAKTSE